jgi:hypothetical protein
MLSVTVRIVQKAARTRDENRKRKLLRKKL